MRFTSVRFDGLASATFKVIGASQEDPYVITDIQGLGPTETEVTIVTPARSQAYHVNSFATSKELTFTINVNPDFASGRTVDQLREELYWMSEDESAEGVLITLIEDGRDICSIRGFVSRFATSIFSRVTDVSITLKCVGDKFAGVNEVIARPYSNVARITPEGTARTFPSVTVEILKPSPSFAIRRLFNVRNVEQEFIALGGFQYVYGNQIQIGSTNGERTVRWRSGPTGQWQDHIRYLELRAKWPNLDPSGVNTIEAWGASYMNADVRILTVQYRPMYRGV